MYQPPKYKNNDPEYIFRSIKQHPFATVVMRGEELLATHIPVLVDGTASDYKLFAHIANHNPMREHLMDHKEMLLIFKGPDAYVSSSWYADPNIPTWDYTAVHINAKIQLQTEEELHWSLDQLIDHFEKDQSHPIASKDIPDDMWAENFKNITGFWLFPFKAVGIEKLHQGFEKKDIITIKKKLNDTAECPLHPISKLLNEKHDL
ncbi:FMN-binding negative transcriptional regulator [Aequorivita sp. SDUM287046]|uniref:FMN-binding negative transcriptional regulator n=1 Tax=Aequorivita aurantiaca TaxID=3053356 RepID=A0ABT8DI72_9FLAO|nr:FMN-binding negative transcriptional regulator [Aequorivita aurantiaca]MDN3725101.1 FMN-binding negative transcriptional regulator [Aequorivita aurantiaca]